MALPADWLQELGIWFFAIKLFSPPMLFQAPIMGFGSPANLSERYNAHLTRMRYLSSSMEKFRFIRFVVFHVCRRVMSACCRLSACLFLAGCATLAPERVAVPSGAVRLTPQWRTSTGSNARTVEVFVENGTAAPLALSNLSLDGVALPALPPERRKKGAPPMPLWWRITPTGDASGRDAPASRRKAAQMCRPCQKDGGIPQSEISCHMREKRG